MKRLIAVIMSVLLLLPCMAADREQCAADFLASAAIDSVSVGVMITDLATGEVLCSINPEQPLLPASTLKSLTVATLVRRLGNGYRFRTPVLINGEVCDSTVRGNLMIVGGGDPSLGSAKHGGCDIVAETVEALKQRGIRRITGDIVFDQSIYATAEAPRGWLRDDLPHPYGTLPHALNFEHNISGSSSVADPSAVLRTRLLSRLAEAGIAIDLNREESKRRVPLIDIYSQPLDDMMRSCMMRSDNLFAECFLLLLSHEATGVGDTATGAQLETDFWTETGLPMEGVVIRDGSGLSRENRVTPKFMTALLTEMADNADYASYFPLTGEEGTVRKFLKGTDLDSYMALKTGTLRNVMSYVGYKLDDDYVPTHAVVVLVNSLPQGRDAARKAVADLLVDIFGNN